MIKISEMEPFAIGGRRECYIHPQHPDRCVKVLREEFAPSKLLKKAGFLRTMRKTEDDFNENISDWKVLDELSRRGDESIWEYLPAFHGWEETDRGRGLVVGLIRDADGLISRSLLDWLRNNGPSEKLDAALVRFSEFWRSHLIPSRSLGLHNISAQELDGGSLRLVMIDGLGSTEFFPLSKYSKAYAMRKCERKITVLREEIADDLAKVKNGGTEIRRGILLKRE